MTILLVSGFLAGLVTATLIFLWDVRIKARKTVGDFDVIVDGYKHHVEGSCIHIIDPNLSAPANCIKCGEGY